MWAFIIVFVSIMNGRLLLLVSLLAGAAAAATGLPSKEMCGLQIPVIPESGVKTKGSMLGSGSGGAVTRTEKLDGADLPYDTVVKRFSGVSSFVKETLASQILCSARFVSSSCLLRLGLFA